MSLTNNLNGTKFISKRSIKGNIGISFISQEDADFKVEQLDNHNCTDCIECSDCFNCTKCTNCYNCTGCIGCVNCFSCSDCAYCDDCNASIGVLIWKEGNANNVVAINGIYRPIATDGKKIQIGDDIYSIEE